MLSSFVRHKYLRRDWNIDLPDQFAKHHAAKISEAAEYHDKHGTLQGWWFFPDPTLANLDRRVLLCLVFEHAFVIYPPHWGTDRYDCKVHRYLRFDEGNLFDGQEDLKDVVTT